MDWPNERYVRLFTRNTTTWRRLLWDGQCMLLQLLRVVDRAGVLDIQDMQPAEAAALHTGAPQDIAERGVSKMLELGVIVHDGHRLLFPNFLEAQECPMSDKLRAKVSRERRASQNVTPESQDVTECHAASHDVTPRHSSPVPTQSVPTQTTTFPAANDQQSGAPQEFEPAGAEHEGYRWLMAVLGTLPADCGSWRRDYAWLGSRPAEERERAGKHIQETGWCMANRSRCTPLHIRKHWLEFLDGPRNFELKPPVLALDFKSQREAQQKAATKARLEKFLERENAIVALAKTPAEREKLEAEKWERYNRLDRSLP